MKSILKLNTNGEPTYSIKAGDGVLLGFYVEVDGSAYDLTDLTPKITIKKHKNSSSAIIDSADCSLSEDTGYYYYRLLPSVTEDMSGEYFLTTKIEITSYDTKILEGVLNVE